MVQNQDNQYMLIGDPLDVESEPYQRYERLLYSSADSLVGWTTAGTGEIDGMVSGTMEAVNNRFQAADYGSGSGWHGPAIKQSLPETVQDFRLQTWITLDNSGTTVGRIELYLLDVNGNQVAKISMKDAKSGERLGYGEARAGGPLDNHFLISEYGDRKGNWNNFAGILRIEREGQHWSAFFGIGNAQNGYHARRRAYWTDTRDKYNTPIAQVVVHMGQYGNHAPCVGGIYSVSVDKINHQEYGTPVIVQTGDLVRFDTKNEDVWINGESRKDILDFGSDFFSLKPGDNQLIVLPDGNFKTTLKYRDTFR
ncbi:phage distal tail protein [Virgibacillus salarius]|uniref:phage distal tail protein n=1 Tax=Virgibacillus salarius TaxID=447199 RepID=UPI003CD0DF7F